MLTTAIFPSRYVQGRGALEQLGVELSRFGGKALALLDPFADDHLGASLEKACAGHVECLKVRFAGECCDEEIGRLVTLAGDSQPQVIVGMGGGKALDTAKALAHELGLPVAVVPTLASSDAPCSALSVIYTAEGAFKRYLILPRNPDLVLVDSQVIAQAPARFLVSGMGDALATWFEAEDCRIRGAANMTGRPGPRTAHALARLCYDTLLEYGPLALQACRQQVVTPALEHVIEANTLLSGLGFESGGLAAAHAIHNGFTALDETHDYWHGEKVAFGVLSMLMLRDSEPALIDEVYTFCIAIGLPVTLADIGLSEVGDDYLLRAAELACAVGESIHNEPFPVDARSVLAAMRTADAEGRRRLELAK
ncbi:glycerol dehydrogenase [Phytopseudomonas dryadis]|uniref:Glycerol dehydrogenase n=1 Tax=Phytopseudomonas dryadis TaxID=2487520 RepID=A0A4Q9RAN0_9GAMM|nr:MULTISPECIES: glycerol dehydrogenase [Pseudomonas]TBU97045.1 glycerol dehydrogenase [Pseudomonas dryadis]TBV08617.1 glycerol dehydrogenase [Pseudomonas dryadis]TBV18985.1 glycerol dehydrogenase [Pseudomonas sp. FRB 230]